MTDADRRSAVYKLSTGVSVQFHRKADGNITAVWDPEVPPGELRERSMPEYQRHFLAFVLNSLTVPGTVVML